MCSLVNLWWHHEDCFACALLHPSKRKENTPPPQPPPPPRPPPTTTTATNQQTHTTVHGAIAQEFACLVSHVWLVWQVAISRDLVKEMPGHRGQVQAWACSKPLSRWILCPPISIPGFPGQGQRVIRTARQTNGTCLKRNNSQGPL